MPAARVCIYEFARDKTGAMRVRYGLSRRAESQVVCTYDTWLRISRHLINEGYQLVEVRTSTRAVAEREGQVS